MAPGSKPIPHGSIPGLVLRPSKTKGHGFWVLRYTNPITKKRTNIGLGSYPEVSIAEVAKHAAEIRLNIEGRRATQGLQAQIKALRPQLEAYETLCAELGQAPALVALAWVLHNPVVTSVISGSRTAEQLITNIKALEIKLSAETLDRLDEIWLGPGGEAPQAYAW